MRKLSRSLLLVGALALTGGLAACGDDVTVAAPVPPVTPTPKVTAVTVSPASSNVRVGGSVQLNAGVTADSGATATVTWKTSDATIATVDATGKVTGVKVGTVGITATAAANGSSASGSAQVNVTNASNVSSITLNPTSVVLNPGQTQGINATVTLDASSTSSDKGVAWATSNAAVATVDAAGVVTAVAPGNATITATANADTAVKTTASVTVRQPTPTQISIQSITVAGNLNAPVNVNNVAGQIDVTLNVDPGDNIISKVEVLVDGNAVCSQSFSGAKSQELRVAAAVAQAAPVPIVCSINTAQFDSLGVVGFLNGTHQLSARAITSTGAQVATPSQALVFNNASGFAASVTNVNASGAVSAIDPRTGLGWIGGDITVTLTPVNFAANTTTSTVNLFNNGVLGNTLFGKTGISLPFTKNANGSFSIKFDAATAWTATNTGIGNYTTPCIALAAPCREPFFLGASTLSSGASGSTTILNLNANALGNPTAFPALNGIRADNSGPGQQPANFAFFALAAPSAVTTVQPVNNIWVNASSLFGAGQQGIPAQATLNSAATPVDPGVDNVTATVYTGAAFAAGTVSGSCNVTGLTATTAGSQLAATIVSTSYVGRVVYTDALGNQTCADFVNTFGADFTAPTASLTAGQAANTGSNVLPTNFTVALSDNASGFNGTPLSVAMSRVDATGATTCVIGTLVANSCTPVQVAGPVDATGGTGIQGYYTVVIAAVDQAGNQTPVTARTYLYDNTAPGFSGGISLQALYAGGSGQFTYTATDNIDVASTFGVVTYPTAAIRFASQSIGTFGVPLEKSASVTYTTSPLYNCVNAAGDFVTTTNKPNLFTATVTDQAANTATLGQAIPGANVQNCGAVGDVAVNSFVDSTVVYGGTFTSVSNGSGTKLATASSSVVLTAIADVPLNTSNNPFPVVNFYFLDAGGNLRLIGAASATLVQTPTNRTWTYKLTWTPSAGVQLGNVTVVAIGADSQFDAVLTGGQTVVVSP